MSRPQVVALRALGLGDLLTAVPALRALRRAFPDHRLVLAAPAPLAPLAALTGAVDETVDTAPLAPLDRRLHGADVAVNLHGRGPQSHRVLEAARPRRLIAFGSDGVRGVRPPSGFEQGRGVRPPLGFKRAREAKPAFDGGAGVRPPLGFEHGRGVRPPLGFERAGVEWRAGEHEVARWCRLLTVSGIAADPADLRLAPPPGVASPAPAATIVHPGAASGARRWPAERWAAVARAEREAGRDVVITGAAAERGLAERVAEHAGLPAASVLAGRTSLLELAALVAAAGRMACGDTGVAHLASAFGTPSVVLFGPVSPAEWGPPATGPHVALWAGLRGDPHAAEPDPGLLEIAPEAVLMALARLPDPPVSAADGWVGKGHELHRQDHRSHQEGRGRSRGRRVAAPPGS